MQKLKEMRKGVFILIKRLGKYTVTFERPVEVAGFAGVAGSREEKGPLGGEFHKIIYDPKGGGNSFEEGESRLQQEALSLALNESGFRSEDIDYIFAGDLLNQCISSSFALSAFSIPYLGQYGACSTMAQSLFMASVFVASKAANIAAAVTSSHFASAERQYRFPLAYGSVRTPTAQRTVTGAGACVVKPAEKGKNPLICGATIGRIVDPGVTDANNMGAAMAAAAADTILRYFEDTGESLSEFDAIFTGDLGFVGSEITLELLRRKGLDISGIHHDCGKMIFRRTEQDVHAGGSGCGCAASVLCAHILPRVRRGELSKVLFMATGALMSPTSSQQGKSIPSVAHLLRIESPII